MSFTPSFSRSSTIRPATVERAQPRQVRPAHRPARQELGQNFLVDPRFVTAIVDLVAAAASPGDPIIEIGTGDGALTRPLAALGNPVLGFEIDERRALALDHATPAHVAVEAADALAVTLPTGPYVLVGNLPFHLTTAFLRRLLRAPGWHTAVLLTQWEVARRRAGVGGASLLTAAWWPWFEFRLRTRVPATAFRPVPSVDGGLFTAHRRPRPLVRERRPYQHFVRAVFSGRGRGVLDAVARTGTVPRNALRGWAAEHGVGRTALPRDLTAEQWAALWSLALGRAQGAARQTRPRHGTRAATL